MRGNHRHSGESRNPVRSKIIEIFVFPETVIPSQIPFLPRRAAQQGGDFRRALFELCDKSYLCGLLGRVAEPSALAQRRGSGRRPLCTRRARQRVLFLWLRFFWASKRNVTCRRAVPQPSIYPLNPISEVSSHVPQGFFDQYQKEFAGCKCNTSF